MFVVQLQAAQFTGRMVEPFQVSRKPQILACARSATAQAYEGAEFFIVGPQLVYVLPGGYQYP